MTRIIDTTSKRSLSAKLAAGFVNLRGVHPSGLSPDRLAPKSDILIVAIATTGAVGTIAPRQWSTAHHIAGDTMASHIIAPPVVYGPGIGIRLGGRGHPYSVSLIRKHRLMASFSGPSTDAPHGK